jgi:hypothetical protein
MKPTFGVGLHHILKDARTVFPTMTRPLVFAVIMHGYIGRWFMLW